MEKEPLPKYDQMFRTSQKNGDLDGVLDHDTCHISREQVFVSPECLFADGMRVWPSSFMKGGGARDMQVVL